MTSIRDFLRQCKRDIILIFKKQHFSTQHFSNYDEYWHARPTAINSFQRERVNIIINILRTHRYSPSSLLDIGCGTGEIASLIAQSLHIENVVGVDGSSAVLAIAKERGVSILQTNFGNDVGWRDIPYADVVLLLEVIEHFQNAEEILTLAMARARCALFFSVPNTGFITHRLRLLFGRFPLQWRVSPGEHVRFWTIADMRLWLEDLGYKNARIVPYQGIPILNKVAPNMFAAGLLVYCDVSNDSSR